MFRPALFFRSLRAPFALTLTLTAAAISGQGCAGDLGDELSENNPPMQTVPGQSGRIKNEQQAGGSIASQINASDMSSWVYMQLSSGKEVTPQDPLNSTEWDLAVQRFQIKVNGGISGNPGANPVVVALASGAVFEQLTQAPKETVAPYKTDQADGADEDTVPDYAFTLNGPWYDYNDTTHILTAKSQVYVVRSVPGTYYKVQMTGYYDSAGTPGYPAFRWQAIAAP